MHSTAAPSRPGVDLRRLAAWVVGGSLFVAACNDRGHSADGTQPGLMTSRLNFSPSNDDPAPARVARYFFEPVKDLDVWDADKAQLRVERVRTSIEGANESAPMVILPGPKSFSRRGGIDLRNVNEVDVRYVASDESWLTVSFWNRDQCLAKTDTVLCIAQHTAFHVVQPLKWPLPSKGLCDRMTIDVRGRADRFAVLSVALNDRAPSSYADPEGKLDQALAFDGDTRSGRWVTTRRRIAARVDLKPNSTLVFGYLQPRPTRRHGSAATLVLKVDNGDGEPLTKNLTLEGDGDDPSDWHRARIDLDDLGSGMAQIEFSMTADGDSACFVANAAVVSPAPQVRPSVLLVTSDTHRADSVAISGLGSNVATPVIDALAARGVYFTNCYSAANSTNPSHSALMTGVHPRDVGIGDNATPLKDAAPTLAEAFRTLGYRTVAAVSIEHLTPTYSGLGQGFDVFLSPFPGGERNSADTVAAALKALEPVGDEPVFLWVHVFDAHAPYNPPKECDRRYYEPKQRDPFDASLPDPGIAPEKLAPELRGLRDLEFPKAQYKAEVTCLDMHLGRLFEVERFREGVTAFVADHGESLGEHGIYFDHAGMYPQSVHIPLALAWPGCPAGKRVDARVMQIDLGHTLLMLAGADASALPGRDLLKTLDTVASPETAAAPRFLLSGNWTSAVIEDGHYYLILTLRDSQDPRLDMQRVSHQVFLFDLERDPDCNHDIAAEQMPMAKQMRAQLIEWLLQRRSLDWAGGRMNDPQFLAQLRQLGYVDLDRPADEPLWEPDDCEWCKRFD